jgi:hypothetical protein
MTVTLVPYETCFRVLVNDIRTPLIIEFLPAGEKYDARKEGEYVADMLQAFSWIEPDEYAETVKQVMEQLN